jgi:hypothetical protein
VAYEFWGYNLSDAGVTDPTPTLLTTVSFESQKASLTSVKTDFGQMYGFYKGTNSFSRIQGSQAANSFQTTFSVGAAISLTPAPVDCQSIDLNGTTLYLTCIDPTKKKVTLTKYTFDAALSKVVAKSEPVQISVDGLESISRIATKIFDFPKEGSQHLVVVVSGQRASKSLTDATVESPTSLYYIATLREKQQEAPQMVNTGLLMFGNVQDLKILYRQDEDKQYLLGLYKDTPCFEGNGFINNNSFKKCIPQQMEQDPRMRAMRKSKYSLKYLYIGVEELIGYSQKVNIFCPKLLIKILEFRKDSLCIPMHPGTRHG